MNKFKFKSAKLAKYNYEKLEQCYMPIFLFRKPVRKVLIIERNVGKCLLFTTQYAYYNRLLKTMVYYIKTMVYYLD